MTINDRRRIYIVVATGDDLAGLEGPDDPRTKTAKGVWAEDALNQNRQLDLFPEAIPEHIRKRSETAGYIAWYLLLMVRPEEVRVELSRPLDMVGDKVAIWAERIILPAFDFGPVMWMLIRPILALILIRMFGALDNLNVQSNPAYSCAQEARINKKRACGDGRYYDASAYSV